MLRTSTHHLACCDVSMPTRIVIPILLCFAATSLQAAPIITSVHDNVGKRGPDRKDETPEMGSILRWVIEVEPDAGHALELVDVTFTVGNETLPQPGLRLYPPRQYTCVWGYDYFNPEENTWYIASSVFRWPQEGRRRENTMHLDFLQTEVATGVSETHSLSFSFIPRVPEPNSLVLLAIASASVLFFRRRRASPLGNAVTRRLSA